MHDGESPSRVLLDPSVLLTDEALGWMETPELGEYLVVSEALVRRLEEPAAFVEELSSQGFPTPDLALVETIRAAIKERGIDTFSYEQAREQGELPAGTDEVCQALLESDEFLADVLADEWAFVTSQSLAIIAEKFRHSLDAFRRVGATLVEVGREEMETALEKVREQIPPGLLKVMKHANDPAVKLVVLGGRIAAIAVPALHLPAQVAGAVRAGTAVIAGDP
jgi:hypothetical protein